MVFPRARIAIDAIAPPPLLGSSKPTFCSGLYSAIFLENNKTPVKNLLCGISTPSMSATANAVLDFFEFFSQDT